MKLYKDRYRITQVYNNSDFFKLEYRRELFGFIPMYDWTNKVLPFNSLYLFVRYIRLYNPKIEI